MEIHQHNFFMLVSGEEVVTAGMSRITSQHHCRVVHVHVQILVQCHCFLPPGTLWLVLVPVVEERRGWWWWGAEQQINTPPSPLQWYHQTAAVWPVPGSTATGLKMPASPSHHPLPSSFQHRANMSTVLIFVCILM